MTLLSRRLWLSCVSFPGFGAQSCSPGRCLPPDRVTPVFLLKQAGLGQSHPDSSLGGLGPCCCFQERKSDAQSSLDTLMRAAPLQEDTPFSQGFISLNAGFDTSGQSNTGFGVGWFFFSRASIAFGEPWLSEYMSNICQCTWINPACQHLRVFTPRSLLLVLDHCKAYLIIQTEIRPPRAKLVLATAWQQWVHTLFPPLSEPGLTRARPGVSILSHLISQLAPLSPIVLLLPWKMAFWVVTVRSYTNIFFSS